MSHDKNLRGPGRGDPREIVKARLGQVAYGCAIGVLMLDCNIPFVPGDVGNASSFSFPVQYRLVPGATGAAVVGRQDPALIPHFVEGAHALVDQGVRAITGDCAYMAVYQASVAAAVDVPVFLSSLLQVPMVVSMLGPDRKLAVLVANGATIGEGVLRPAGITEELADRLVVKGLEDKPYFRAAMLDEVGEKDMRRMEEEIVEAAVTVLESNPSVGAFLLECSDMPPYSEAIQRATGLPVFDWIGFINYVHHAVVCQPYVGFI
jgi:hypothetical protein